MYAYCETPEEKASIQLECPDIPPKKNVHLHIFEQLLMIYVGGLKHLWSDSEGKVELTKLTEENIQLMKRYFESINYEVNIEVFDLSKNILCLIKVSIASNISFLYFKPKIFL